MKYTPAQIARELFGIHTHAELVGSEEIVYRHSDIVSLLQKLGMPAPDYKLWNDDYFTRLDYLCEKYLISKPGDTLAESIESLGLTMDQFARRINYTTDQVQDIISARKPITKGLAIKLEQALGIDKSFWINRQRLYWQQIDEADELDQKAPIPIHPGEYFKEQLDLLGCNLGEFPRDLGLTFDYLSRLYNSQATIGEGQAKILEEAFKQLPKASDMGPTDKQTWIDLQKQYDLHKATTNKP